MPNVGVASSQPAEGIDFCTLGMFIIDDIDFEGDKPSVYGIIGGAASFAVVGARMVAGKQHGKAVSWILDIGSDFPKDILDVVQSWGTGCAIRQDQGRLTTRAWNGYGANEKRDFKYLTPKLRLEPFMLSDDQLLSKTFHMVCSSQRCIHIVEEILRRRKELQEKCSVPSSGTARPIFVWEPVPDLCSPEEQDKFLAACRVVDVVSPNELELGMMFGRPGWTETDADDREVLERILRSGIGPEERGTIVIRAGKEGSYSYSRGKKRLWLPAYHQPEPSQRLPVVDPTGAGNSFLGALAEGMIIEGREPDRLINDTLGASDTWNKLLDTWGDHGRVPKALVCATVAAGFVVEQIGVPRVSARADGSELWNGIGFTERLRMYTQRLCRTLEESSETHDWLVD